MSALRRPDMSDPGRERLRFEILRLMWLLGWSIVRTAKEFVLHRNTEVTL
jgi:hypothetical protein